MAINSLARVVCVRINLSRLVGLSRPRELDELGPTLASILNCPDVTIYVFGGDGVFVAFSQISEGIEAQQEKDFPQVESTITFVRIRGVAEKDIFDRAWQLLLQSLRRVSSASILLLPSEDYDAIWQRISSKVKQKPGAKLLTVAQLDDFRWFLLSAHPETGRIADITTSP